MKRVIFDCDNTFGISGCDVDDGLALLYLLGQKDKVHIEAIATTYGNNNVDTVYTNTKRMLAELGLEHLPVYKGCPAKDVTHSEAADYIVQAVQNAKDDIYVLATGSLTNIYQAYCIDNTLFQKISGIVLMGGLTEPLVINNVNMNELNFSCDPEASYVLLSKAKNVSVITGNNCIPAFFSYDEYRSRLNNSQKAIGKYIYKKTRYWFEYMMDNYGVNGFYNWDVVAAAYIAEENLFVDNSCEINPTNDSLKKGYLYSSEKEYININLPKIKDIREFTENIYKSWLSVNLFCQHLE
ncbi:MAG TPA: nucleoside hydrolase [Clostridiaceae bacterium]|nr:nucleoside hydrolase [Clostridiaceae bacterium]